MAALAVDRDLDLMRSAAAIMAPGSDPIVPGRQAGPVVHRVDRSAGKRSNRPSSIIALAPA
jgi:hypothetical protein